MVHETTVAQKPLVSVVIEGYNESRFFGTAHNTMEALKQQDSPVEVIGARSTQEMRWL